MRIPTLQFINTLSIIFLFALAKNTRIFSFYRNLTEVQKNGENMQLICVSSIENASKIPRYCDASCQANYESLTEPSDFKTKVS